MLQVFLPLIGVQHIRAFKGQGQECAAARVKSWLARTELLQLYELAEQGVTCGKRILDVERQAEKLERITR